MAYNLTCRLAQVPAYLLPFYRDLINIPRVLLVADSLEPARKLPDRKVLFTVTAAILLQADLGLPDDFRVSGQHEEYVAFVSFYPAEPTAVASAAEWLEDVYVLPSYSMEPS